MTKLQARILQQGFTLIELMIAVAIVAILAAVAIPAYFTYIQEAALQSALFNLKTMRVSVEEFRFYDPSGQYPNGNFSNIAIDNQIGWNPGNMGPVGTVGAKYDYTLESLPGGYSIYAEDLVNRDDDGNLLWVRCDNNGQACCYSIHPLTAAPNVACPAGAF